MTKTVALLPCPFCGTSDVHADSIYDGEERVFCTHCDTQGPMRRTQAEAIAAWNTRPQTDQQLRKERDALLEKPISLAKMDSIDDDATDRMIAYYWCEQAQEARDQAQQLREEVERLSDLLDTERYKVAIGVQGIARAVQGRRWLSQPGRGSYAWDDERYQQEFGAAIDEIEAALRPLQAVAQDWSDCPTDPLRVAANRDRARSSLSKEGSR